MNDDAETVVRNYYDALRSGDPLTPYFLESETTVKFGISETLVGYEEVATALERQTETTDDWTVESNRLAVAEEESFATVTDEVRMAWTDTTSGERNAFESRWSGTLVPATESDGPAWLFRTMHVSAPSEVA